MSFDLIRYAAFTRKRIVFGYLKYVFFVLLEIVLFVTLISFCDVFYFKKLSIKSTYLSTTITDRTYICGIWKAFSLFIEGLKKKKKKKEDAKENNFRKKRGSMSLPLIAFVKKFDSRHFRMFCLTWHLTVIILAFCLDSDSAHAFFWVKAVMQWVTFLQLVLLF